MEPNSGQKIGLMCECQVTKPPLKISRRSEKKRTNYMRNKDCLKCNSTFPFPHMVPSMGGPFLVLQKKGLSGWLHHSCLHGSNVRYCGTQGEEAPQKDHQKRKKKSKEETPVATIQPSRDSWA